MITAILLKCPLDPFLREVRHLPSGTTARQAKEAFGVFGPWEVPTVASLGEDFVVGEEWDQPIPNGRCLVFAPIGPEDGGILIPIIISFILTTAVTLFAMSLVPDIKNTEPNQADTVYSLKGQTNQIRLNEPIESAFGRHRNWPSYAAKPYNQFISGEQWQFSLFSCGHGEIDIEQIYIEDTPIGDFIDVEHQIVLPGQEVTLFRDNVQTSTEVAGIELYGSNEPEYSGYFTAVANDANTMADKLELDLVFPTGLYRRESDGNLKAWTVVTEYQAMEIDEFGAEIGTWQTLFTWTATEKTTSPKRVTLSFDVTPGRYKVRARRTNDKDTRISTQNTIQWDALRAYLPDIRQYGETTVIAVKARATSNLNDQSARKFNYVGTRKLRRLGVGPAIGETLEKTTRIVDAFIEIFTAAYGPALADTYLDLDTLYDLETRLFTPEGREFNWIFDKQETVWETARIIARAGRCIPMLRGSLITVVRDEPRPVQHLFTPHNIIQDSFSVGVTLFQDNDFDSIEVEYNDNTTWKEETVLCYRPDRSFAIRPDKVRLPGVTNRDWAYREGMYMVMREDLQREQITFRTGIEGFLAGYGDHIMVDIDNFGMDGVLSGFVQSFDGATVVLDGDAPFDPDPNVVHYLAVSKADGTLLGPLPVTAVVDAPKSVALAEAPDPADFNFDPNGEPPMFTFYQSQSFTGEYVITKMAPSGGDEVEIEAVPYTEELYTYDGASAIPLSQANQLVTPDNPRVTSLEIITVAPGSYSAVWSPAFGAQFYRLQFTIDPDNYVTDPNEAWQTLAQQEGTQFPFQSDEAKFFLRVAAVNVGQGPWVVWGGFLTRDNRADRDGNTRVTRGGDIRIIKG